VSRPRSSPWRYGFLRAPQPALASGLQPGQVSEFEPAEIPGAARRVITIVSAKGGVGKTTVATNLAVGLARHAPGAVVLLDADVQFGDVATALNLTPAHTLPDAVSPGAAGDPIVLKTYLTPHSSGFFTVCSASSPVDGDRVTSDELGHLIGQLSEIFPFVIIDTASGLGFQALAALDAATDAVFVCGLSVSGARSLRTELAVLASIGVTPSRRQIIVNLVDKDSGLSVRDIEGTLEMPVDGVIARNSRVALAMNRGIPLLQDSPAGGAASGFTTLVRGFIDPDLVVPVPRKRMRTRA
jgi:pilus assembly protein CpaE